MRKRNSSILKGLLSIATVTCCGLNAAWAVPTQNVSNADTANKKNSEQSIITRMEIAPCIANDSTFQLLMNRESWETAVPSLRTDANDEFRTYCAFGWGDPGHDNAYRAKNLAESGHYDEAIDEITKGITSAEKASNATQPYNLYNLNEYLATRMKLSLKAGQYASAVADAERLLAGGFKFPSAVCLTENGKTKVAEAVFATMINDPQTNIFESYYRYLLAFCEECNGKPDKAREDYLVAAEFFAMAGKDEAMKECLDSANKYSKRAKSIANLKPPLKNKHVVVQLVKFLTSEKKAFDANKLKIVLGADSVEKRSDGSLQFRFRDPKSSAFNLIQVGRETRSSGSTIKSTQKLFIRINTFNCTLTHDECNQLIAIASASAPTSQLQERIGTVRSFTVPSGLLEMSWYKGGFGGLYTLELFEGISQHIPPTYVKWHPHSDEDWDLHIHQLLSAKKVAEARRAGNEWLEKGESMLCMRGQGRICAAEGDYAKAIVWIDKAIAKDKMRGIPNHGGYIKYYFEIDKAEYLLASNRIEAAESILDSVKPTPVVGDDYFLRAKIAIAKKNYPVAIADLKRASEKYFEEFLIVKRDRADKLITELNNRMETEKQW